MNSDAREEIRELERLWQESPESAEFRTLRQGSKWGERIREEVIERIKRGQADAIEDGIFFLERSPRYFRSGYHKCAIAAKLKSAPLTELHCRRLRKVILDSASSTNVGPEFSEYARLAVVVADATFVENVSQRLQSSTGWVRKRYSRVLSLCRKHCHSRRTE